MPPPRLRARAHGPALSPMAPRRFRCAGPKQGTLCDVWRSYRRVSLEMMVQDVRGKIVPGHGRATAWLSDGVLASAIGKELFDGTMNVLVLDPAAEHRFLRQDLAPGAIKARGAALFCPCSLNGHRAFIVATWLGARPAPERPGFEIQIPGTTMLEVVADHGIPGIAYGADVELRYDPDEVQTRSV